MHGYSFYDIKYTVHVTCQDIDGGATEADGAWGQCPSVASYTPLEISIAKNFVLIAWIS